MQVNMILLPEMVSLDLVGPFDVLSRVPGWKVDLVGADLSPVRSDKGMAIVPTVARESALKSDLLVIPGGKGVDIAMLDAEWVEFVRVQAEGAQCVFGICTGAFLLGAAGLLKGKRASTHWRVRELLARFGAIPGDERIVVDGKFYTSGGVTSGIDAALRVVADIAGEKLARMVQLGLEYDPAPPFEGGTPFSSPQEIVEMVFEASKGQYVESERSVAEAVARLE